MMNIDNCREYLVSNLNSITRCRYFNIIKVKKITQIQIYFNLINSYRYHFILDISNKSCVSKNVFLFFFATQF